MPRRRPSRSDRQHVLQLLRDHSFAEDLPTNVAEALLTLLVDAGFFIERDSSMELATDPGVTLLFPADAGRRIRQALLAWSEGPVDAVLPRCMRGSGAAGSGSGLSASTLAALQFRKGTTEEELARWDWNRDALIASLPTKNEVASSIVDYLGDRMRQSLTGEQPSSDSEQPSISPKQGPIETPPAPVASQQITVEYSGVAKRTSVRICRHVAGQVSDVAEVRGPSLVRLFEIVSGARGESLSWADVNRLWAQATDWKGKLLTEKTLQDYGRRVKRVLTEKGFGKYWRCTTDQVSWQE